MFKNSLIWLACTLNIFLEIFCFRFSTNTRIYMHKITMHNTSFHAYFYENNLYSTSRAGANISSFCICKSSTTNTNTTLEDCSFGAAGSVTTPCPATNRKTKNSLEVLSRYVTIAAKHFSTYPSSVSVEFIQVTLVQQWYGAIVQFLASQVKLKSMCSASRLTHPLQSKR